MAPTIAAHSLTGDVHFKSNPNLYEYVVDYGDDDVSMKYLLNTVDDHIRFSREYRKACTAQAETVNISDKLVACMQQMHAATQQKFHEMTQKLDMGFGDCNTGFEDCTKGITTMTTTLENAASDIGTRVLEKVSPGLLGLLDTIKTASSNLDLDAIKTHISSSLGDLMAADRKETAEQLQQTMQDHLTAPLKALRDELLELSTQLPSDVDVGKQVSEASAPQRTAMSHLQQTLLTSINELNKGMATVETGVASATQTFAHVKGNTEKNMALAFSKIDAEGKRVQSMMNNQQQLYTTIANNFNNGVLSMQAVGEDSRANTTHTGQLVEIVNKVKEAVD